MNEENKKTINISREAFASYEEENQLLRNSCQRATDILNLYAKHMPVGFLRHMRDEMNKERENSPDRPLNLLFLEDLEMKIKLHKKYHNIDLDKINEIQEDRKKIFNRFLERREI
tara:strand:+ start:157 stop:501 length:345 start_codon:yes stop_codon:yes gene_type:complete